MNLFLDSSVLLAASRSADGAARALFTYAPYNGWTLLTSAYAVGEVTKNLQRFPPEATSNWIALRRGIGVMDDVVAVDLPVVFPISKDRPILFTALAWSPCLVTLDRGDFSALLGKQFYGMEIATPAEFFRTMRSNGTLRERQ